MHTSQILSNAVGMILYDKHDKVTSHSTIPLLFVFNLVLNH